MNWLTKILKQPEKVVKGTRKEVAPKTGMKTLLIILDGWGLSPDEQGNGPLIAKTPTLDYIYSAYPKTLITASGVEVGLRQGEPGNSEVGHSNIGSGRIVWESLPMISEAIEDGSLFENEVLKKLMYKMKRTGKVLHLIGLVSDGGVHSHIDHLKAILKMATDYSLKEVVVHFIADGRDTSPREAERYITELEEMFNNNTIGRIGTIIGRYLAMDRDNNWDRMQLAVDLIIKGKGQRFETAQDAIKAAYKLGLTDEFMTPSLIGYNSAIKSGDGILMFNFRTDRMKQMARVFLGDSPANVSIPRNLSIVTMTQYLEYGKYPVVFSPSPKNATNALPEVVSKAKLKQFHTAETEKYAHVTYFLNAGRYQKYEGETDVLVASKKVGTYDRVPEMSAREILEKVKLAISKNNDLIVVNFANGDMVGHTGVLQAVVTACEVVDNCLGQLLPLAAEKGYRTIVTADHGNCEVMIDEVTGGPFKEHTNNPVPFVYLDFQQIPFQFREKGMSQKDYLNYCSQAPTGVLADVAPTILASLGLTQPKEMAGLDISNLIDTVQ